MTPRPPFEDRLDSYIEEGPATAPDQILDTVLAAIPSIPQRRAAWRGPWKTTPMLGFARALAGLVIVIGLGAAALFLVVRPNIGGVGDQPSASPSGPASSGLIGLATPSPSAPSSAPSPSAPATEPAVAACATASLSARITLWEGAAGHRIADVELKNVGSAACTISSMAKPQLLDGHSTILIDGSLAKGSTELSLEPGGVLKTLVQDANYCGAPPPAPVTVAFVQSDGSRIVATPFSPTDATVPPCNGAGQAADIEMQPWAP